MLYQRGRYRVEVGNDGSIRVKGGDWLSKYSAAIHNSFTAFHQFARQGKAGEPLPIANFNLIFAGETLLHLPTYYGDFDPTEIRVRRPSRGPELTDEQKKQITLDTLKRDHGLKGDNLPILSKVIEIMGYTENAIGLAEVAGLLAEGGAVAAAGTALSVAGAFLSPIAGAISVVNASEFGLRLVGMRAVAYGTTAWAFGDPMPPFPAAIRDNLQLGHARQTADYEKAWVVARDAAVRGAEEDAAKKKVSPASYRVLLRALGGDDRKALVREMMKGFEKGLKPGFEREMLWKPPPNYPN